jgi:hypothetical protein
LLVGTSSCDACSAAAENREKNGRKFSSQKIQKSPKSLLTLRVAADYIRLTNDGGDAAGDQEVRF